MKVWLGIIAALAIVTTGCSRSASPPSSFVHPTDYPSEAIGSLKSISFTEAKEAPARIPLRYVSPDALAYITSPTDAFPRAIYLNLRATASPVWDEDHPIEVQHLTYDKGSRWFVKGKDKDCSPFLNIKNQDTAPTSRDLKAVTTMC